MAKRNARSGFKHLRDQEVLDLSATVLGAMDGNPNFTTPVPDIADVQDAHDDYAQKLHVAKRGSQLQVSLKNDAREVLIGLLKRLAFYVNTVADGSLTVVLSSGFRPMGLPTSAQVPNKPERVRLKSWLQSGQVQLIFDPSDGAWLYEYQYTSSTDAAGLPVWPDELLTTTRGNLNMLAPLTPGVCYFVRVRARNGLGYSDWTTPEHIFAQ